MNFQIGDLVQLKSGGPNMTVTLLQDGKAWCTWFNREATSYEPKEAHFPVAALEKV